MNVGPLLRTNFLRIVVPAVIAVVAVQLWMYRATSMPGAAPRPVSGLQDIQSLSDLQTRFVQDAGTPRLVLLISPT